MIGLLLFPEFLPELNEESRLSEGTQGIIQEMFKTHLMTKCHCSLIETDLILLDPDSVETELAAALVSLTRSP